MSRPAPSKLRLAGLVLTAVLPGPLRLWTYRKVFGYRIAKGVTIGLSLIDARECAMESGTRIGHGNVFYRLGTLKLGEHVEIGYFNVFRGGQTVELGRYSKVNRLNEINSIPDPWVVTEASPELFIGPGAVIEAGHKIDFTDRVEIGRRAIISGRNSSIWTHNRQRTAPVTIGEQTYVGSEVRIAPGSRIPARSIVGMGAVVTSALDGPEHLFAGVPARSVRPLDRDDLQLIECKTRVDLPDDV